MQVIKHQLALEVEKKEDFMVLTNSGDNVEDRSIVVFPAENSEAVCKAIMDEFNRQD